MRVPDQERWRAGERLPPPAAAAELEVIDVSSVAVVEAFGPARFVDVPSLADVADTTGAGDAFAAGYIAAALTGHRRWMRRGPESPSRRGYW